MATAAAPTTEGSIFYVALDGSAGSGKTALREALFGQSFKEERISNEIVKFTSNFARLVIYELQGAEGSKGRLTALTELMAAAKTQIHVYWYLYDASSPTVFTADLLEGTNNDAYLHTQIILTKADALSQAQLNTLKTSIEDKIKNASWVKAKDAYPVVTQRKLVFDAECPKCSSKNIFVNHKQLRWMCSECNGTGSFPASQNLAPLLTATTKALPEKLQPYFVGAQQVDSAYKQTFAVEIIKKAAEEGLLVSGVAAVERITKALWVDLALVMPTPSGIAAKLIRLMSFSMWLSSLSERIGWVIAELVHKSKNPWTIATSGLMVARFLWLAVNAEYKLHSDPFLAEQGAQLHDLILKAVDGPRDLSRNAFYLRLHAIVDDQYMDLWQHVNKADGYETCETFVWSWKMADFTPNRSTDAVLGDLLKGHHLPPTDHFSALAPIYLQHTTPQAAAPVASQASGDPLVPVPFSPAPIPVVARIKSPKP